MNEKEKMLNGLKHNPVMDENLIADRTVCKAKCFEYNNLKQSYISVTVPTVERGLLLVDF